MYRITRNQHRTRTACPVLEGGAVEQYLNGGELPSDAKYLAVPPGLVLIKRGVWITTDARVHAATSLYLVATDNHDLDLEGGRADIDCYYSPVTRTHFIGRVEQNKLCSLLADEYPDVPLEQISYVGKVVASV